MKNPHPARRRVYILLGFFGAFLLLFFAVLYDAQVVHGSENRAKSITSNTASEPVTASRGIITDRNGKGLVSNRLAYTLVFDKSAFGKDDGALNDAIWRLIQLCQELDVPWNDTLPLTTGVIPQLKTAARSNAFQEYLKDNELPENASASELIGALRKLYAIDERYTTAQARLIAGVRYELALHSPYVFAEDVSVGLISQIVDGHFTGVTTGTSSARVYDTIYAAHIGRLQAPPANPAHARRNALTDRLEDILLSSHYLHFGTGNTLRLPPIVTPSMVEWSNNKGLSLKTRIRFNSQWDNRQRLTARISAGYNFKRREFYWKAPVEWLFSPQHEGKITLEAGNGNHIYNSKQAKDIRQQMSSKQNYDSLINIFDRYAFDYYNDYYVKLQTSYDPWPGLSVNAGLVYHNRTLTDWNEIGGREGLIHRYRSLAPNLRVEWTPGLYYYRNKEEAVPLFSRWPTFSCEYERGIKAFHNGCAYERWELEGNYRFNLHALRYLYLRAGGGLYTQRENTYFVDYTNFRYSALPETWLDEMAGTFEALDSRWYNESKYYVRACTSYESPMLLLARFNPVSPIVKRERLYCNLLSVHALNPYVEIGYSMATHLFDIGLFVGAANRSGTSFGWKFVLRFYEDN